MVQVDIKYSDPYDHHTANSLTANMKNIGQQPGEVGSKIGENALATYVWKITNKIFKT